MVVVHKRARLLVLSCLVMLAGAASGHAEPPVKQGAQPSSRGLQALKQSSTTEAKQDAKLALPDAENIVVLVRTSLLTLNDAVLTGNFTVFRDKLSPTAREQASASSLADAFVGLRKARVDMSGISVLAPQLVQQPAINDVGFLSLQGQFTYQTVALKFALEFEAVRGRWLLRGISADVSQAQNVAIGGAEPRAGAVTSKK